MSAVPGVPACLRTRLLLCLAAVLAVLVPPALGPDAALAGSASMRPSVQGYGAVTAPAYTCSNSNRDDRVVVTSCGTATAFSGFLTDAVLTMTATASPANGNQFARWEGCTTTSVGATATVNGTTCTLQVSWFHGDATITPRAVFDDVAGPVVSAVSPVFSTVTDRGVSFGATVNEDASALECSVDDGAFAACGSVRQLAEGSHQVKARAVDRSGNQGLTSAPTSFRVVDTRLVSGPPDFSASTRPTFTYSTVAGMRFECSIDSVVIATRCGDKDPGTNQASFTPPVDLAEGVHTFRVEAIDGPDFDRVPVVRTWRVDTTAPVMDELTSPTVLEGVVTTGRSATFTWSATEAGAIERFECRLDGGIFEPCTSPMELADLPLGERTFSVRGVDRAGNVGEPLTRRWTVAGQDRDGDGFDERSDCDDANARINPGAADTPDNGVDENCDGADAKSQTATGTGPAGGVATGGAASLDPVNPTLLSAKGSARRTRIVFSRLTATRVPVGAQITATCKAGRRGACPFRTKRLTARGATVNLIAALAPKRRGKAGKSLTFGAPAVLTVTVTRAGLPRKTLRYTISKGKFPRVRVV